MTSFLLIGKNHEKRHDVITELCGRYGIDRLDQSMISSESGASETTDKKSTSIGIKTIRLMQQKVMLKPLRSTTKAVILEDADLLTIEAQNALLKTLEEPPESTIIILAANRKDALLPTIISRCSIIDIHASTPSLTAEEQDMLTKEFLTVSQAPIGQRLSLAEQLAKNKEDALIWLERMQLTVRDNLISGNGTADLDALKALIECRRVLQTTNANPRLALEYCLIQFG